jgi:hypothetical protein
MRFFNVLCFGLAFVCAVLLFPLALIAADAEIASTVVADPWWHMLLVDVLIGLGAVAMGLLGRALTVVFDWLAERTKLSFLARVDDAAMDIVTDLYAKEVEHAKKAKADRKLTKEEREKFASIAAVSLKSWLGTKGLAQLGKIFSGSAEDAIKAKIEKAVAVSKNAGKLARGSEIAKALGAASDPQGSSASLR